jgi:ligand-binding sensor domain-containing protein/signal transduction histidine kinase/CheY-like chemotaxis protein/AraC-like DNA-binding protein
MVLSLALLLLIAAFPATARYHPDPSYTSYNTDNGLSNSIVHAIVQDNNGIMWFGTEDGLNRFDGRTFKTYRFNTGKQGNISGNIIHDLYLDASGKLWVSTDNGLNLYEEGADGFLSFNVADGLSHRNVHDVAMVDGKLWIATDLGLNILNPSTGKIEQIPFDADGTGTSHKWIRQIADLGNDIWIGTWNGGLNRYNKQTGKFTYYRHNESDASSLSSDTIFSLFVDHKQQLWIGTVRGAVNRFEPQCDCFTRFQPYPDISNLNVSGITERNGELWLATSAGATRLNNEHQKFQNYRLLKDYELGNITRDIRSIFTSRDGTLWLGSFQMGVVAIPQDGFAFKTYRYSELSDNSLKSDDINSLFIDVENNLWTGSVGGLFRYPLDESGRLGKAELVLDTFTLKMHPSRDGSYWLATNDGLYHLSKDRQILSHFDHTQLISDPTSEGAVLDVAESNDGVLYAANWRGGLVRLDNEQKGIFTQIGEQGSERASQSLANIYSLQFTPDGQLWIGTMDGIARLNPADNKLYHYPLQTSERQPKVVVYYVYWSESGLWLGTNNGVYQYLSEQDSFQQVPLSLNSSYVQGIVEESPTVLWLSTFNGLYRWNRALNELEAFFKTDGLQGSEFNTKAVYRKEDGTLFFAGVDGVSSINPSDIGQSTANAVFQWTTAELKRKNQSNTLNLAGQEELTLAPDVSNIQLNYFVDDFNRPELHQYRYRLNGGDWVDNGNNTRLSLNELAVGDYSVEVQYKSRMSSWHPIANPLRVIMNPPIYTKPLAVFSYILILLCVVFLIYRRRLSNLKKQKIQLENLVSERTAEVRQLLEQKQHLFSNISHELRTPLTLITAPIEHLAADDSLSASQKNLLNIAKNNSHRLFRLVERVLSLTTVEQKQKHIEPIHIDDIIIRYTIAFDPLMAQKHIQFDKHIASKAVIQGDKDDIDSILENLLSNAFKYTASGGWVRLRSTLENSTYQLRIENAHRGLSTTQTTKVFERFERLGQSDSEQGFGLGLAYVQEICRQNNWLIECSSTDNSVEFCLTIQGAELQKSSSTPAQRQIIELGLNKKEPNNSQQQSILVIEDNDELRGFLAEILSMSYSVSTAENGSLGLQQAIEHMPDLIISDVMMPELDGFSLIKALSQHDNTCHIPSILLTAKADQPSQLLGLEMGAVDYITKPFDARQLLLKVKNILNQHQALLKLRLHGDDSGTEQVTYISERDKRFCERLNELIDTYYPNSEFGVEQLVSRIAMSERQLQRKLKALFNQTPAEYLRNYRLVKAKELLLEGKSITIVSDLVGFNSASYFSRSFKAAFEMSPSEFIQNI